MSRSYTSSPRQVPPWCVAGLLYFTLFCPKFLPLQAEQKNIELYKGNIFQQIVTYFNLFIVPLPVNKTNIRSLTP
jgi:hypothetical protein